MYTPTGELLVSGFADSVGNSSLEGSTPWNTIYRYTDGNFANAKNLNTTVQDLSGLGIPSMDLTANLMFTTASALVGDYDLGLGMLRNVVPVAPGRFCSGMVALYDGTFLVGCSSNQTGHCAYLEKRRGCHHQELLHATCVPSHMGQCHHFWQGQPGA